MCPYIMHIVLCTCIFNLHNWHWATSPILCLPFATQSYVHKISPCCHLAGPSLWQQHILYDVLVPHFTFPPTCVFSSHGLVDTMNHPTSSFTSSFWILPCFGQNSGTAQHMSHVLEEVVDVSASFEFIHVWTSSFPSEFSIDLCTGIQ